MMPPNGSRCDADSDSGRVIPPRRSTQWAQPSEQDLRLEGPGVVVDGEGTRCSIHPGQVHSKPQEHPVPANNATDLIEGIEVGVAKGGTSRSGRLIRPGSKSKGGRSGPLTGPVFPLSLTAIGLFLEAQQLFLTTGGSVLGRMLDGEVTRGTWLELVEVET